MQFIEKFLVTLLWFQKYIFKKSKSSKKKISWHVQFIENISCYIVMVPEIYFQKKPKVQNRNFLACAIHRKHLLLHCLKKEIATAKELDLRQSGKVLIFRYRHTEPSYYI